MKTILIAAAALLTLSAMPALAGEGTGDIFALRTPGVTTTVVAEAPDTGSSQYPVVANRPGSFLGVFASDIVPATGNETPVQTANSLPRGAERGNLAYVQLRPAVPLMTAGR
ncbi:MAG TPA: hypothetical protein VGC15_10365 [Acetobacteraceae bacterium]